MDPVDGRGNDREWFNSLESPRAPVRHPQKFVTVFGLGTTPLGNAPLACSTLRTWGEDSRDQVRKRSSADANNLAVERLVSLLNEVVAKGALPAL